MPKGVPAVPRAKKPAKPVKPVHIEPAINKPARNFPRIAVNDERYLCAAYCNHFTHNLTLMHRLCFSIMMYFIKKNILMTPILVNQVFDTFKMKPVIFFSTLRNIKAEENVMVLYPFGFNEFREIRLDFGVHNIMPKDTALNAFIRFVGELVCCNFFRKTETFDNCTKVYDLPLLDAPACKQAIHSMRCQFFIFIDYLFCPSNSAFFMSAAPIMAHLESMKDIAYENFPVEPKKLLLK